MIANYQDKKIFEMFVRCTYAVSDDRGDSGIVVAEALRVLQVCRVQVLK